MTAKQSRDFRARRKAAGLCSDCSQPAREGKSRCQVCHDKCMERRQARIDSGQCVSCSNNSLPNHQKCKVCVVKAATYQATGSRKNWEAVLGLFTGQCAVSGLPIEIGKNAHLDHRLPKSTHPELIADLTNLQWVHRDVNYAKRNLHPQLFLELCKKVVDFNRL